ncbi:hypothetical protein HYY75_00700, partial [bacterium]|nr:hypothetical protein [bacterium]
MNRSFSRRNRYLSLILFLICSSFSLFAADSNVMFVVNDPQEITFTNLQNLIEFTKSRLLESKTVSDRDVVNFWEAVRGHGVPNAGQEDGNVRVALVVPKESQSAQGILVLKGSFDKKAVLELISRRYAEHVNEHIADGRQRELGIGAPVASILGFPTHRFVLPLRDRELHIVDLGKTVIFASHQKGDTSLLLDTIKVLTGKKALKSPSRRSSSVTFAFEPTPEEQVRLLGQIDDSYRNYREGRMEHRRGVKRFSENLRRVVVDKKVEQFKRKVSDMKKAVFHVEKLLNGSSDSKLLTLTLVFQSSETAQAVKAGVVQHMVSEIKKPSNLGFQLGLKNPNVSANGSSVVIRVPLETEKDQLHAFSIMATYIARGIMSTRQPPIVRRLKFISDQEARVGRKLDSSLHAELARTSFFSFGRKFSLMFSGMKVRSNIRRSEDTYVDLSKDPKVLHESVQKLVEVSSSNLNELDKLIASKEKDYSKKAVSSQSFVSEFALLRVMKVELTGNARLLVATARSQSYQKLAGPLPKKLNEMVSQLAQKAGEFHILPMGKNVQMFQTGLQSSNSNGYSEK